jgi:hypothetical protein
MSREKTSLTEVAQDAPSLKTAREEPIQQVEQPRQQMDFIRSLVLDIPLQAVREAPVQESINIESILHAQLETESKKNEGSSDKIDTVTVDVPLLLRLLEYAKEDAKTDMDLHNVTEKLIELSKNNEVLTMSQYEAIVSNTLGGNTDYPNPAFAGDTQSESLDAIKKLAGIK